MRKHLLALGLLLGLLGAPALAVVPSTQVGDAAYTILATDFRIQTTTVFTASRTWTLPFASASCVGQTCAPPANSLEIVDSASAFSVQFPLVIAPQSGNTINGSSSNITVNITGARVTLIPTNGSNWQLQVISAQGQAIGTAPTVFHGGGAVYPAVTSGNDSTAVNTETYIEEVFVPVTTTLTGVSWINLATSTGNVQFSLADSTGKVITAAQTASTAAGTSAAYQQVAFAAPYLAYGPAKYFILMQNSGSNHYRAHTIGNFGCSKKTGETFGTFTNVTAPTTFTTNLCPVIDTY